MIKIEFKECLVSDDNFKTRFMFCNKSVNIGEWRVLSFKSGNNMFLYESNIKSIIPYIPQQDEYLDRSFILSQLGISKE